MDPENASKTPKKAWIDTSFGKQCMKLLCWILAYVFVIVILGTICVVSILLDS